MTTMKTRCSYGSLIFTVIAFLAAFGLFICADISLEIFCKAILLAYLCIAWEAPAMYLHCVYTIYTV